MSPIVSRWRRKGAKEPAEPSAPPAATGPAEPEAPPPAPPPPRPAPPPLPPPKALSRRSRCFVCGSEMNGTYCPTCKMTWVE